MSKKKKIILFSSIAAGAIVLGIAAALIFSSLGTGNSFKKGGSCASKTNPSVEAETPAPTSPSIVLVTPEPTGNTAENDTPEPTEEPTPEPTEVPIDPYEELLEMGREDHWVTDLLSLTDILVDGRYVEAERDLTLIFRGSRNQRVIDMKKTLETGEIVLWEN